MAKETYILPVKIEIEADNPDTAVREIAEIMYDEVNEYTRALEFNETVKWFDMEYSIYKKPDPSTFGQK